MSRLVAAQTRVHHLGKNFLATSVPGIVVVAREHRHHDFLFGHDDYSLVSFSGGANDVVAIVSRDPAAYHMKPYPMVPSGLKGMFWTCRWVDSLIHSAGMICCPFQTPLCRNSEPSLARSRARMRNPDAALGNFSGLQAGDPSHS